MKKTILKILLCVAMVAFAYGACSFLDKKDSHVHGWSKWEGTNVLYRVWDNHPVTEQRRLCTNCGYVQTEVH